MLAKCAQQIKPAIFYLVVAGTQIQHGYAGSEGTPLFQNFEFFLQRHHLVKSTVVRGKSLRWGKTQIQFIQHAADVDVVFFHEPAHLCTPRCCAQAQEQAMHIKRGNKNLLDIFEGKNSSTTGGAGGLFPVRPKQAQCSAPHRADTSRLHQVVFGLRGAG